MSSVIRAFEPRLNIVRSGLVIWIDPSLQTSYESGGTIFDLSGNGHNGTLTNGPTFNSDNGGNIVLDGTNDYITFGDNNAFTLSSGLTLQIWVKLNPYSNTTNASFISKFPLANTTQKEYYFGINAGDVYVGGNRNTTTANYRGRYVTSTASNGFIAANTWVMCTGTYNGGSTNASWAIYINGTKRDNADYGGGTWATMVNGTEPLTIGYPNWSISLDYLNGNIGSALIYNRALSADEISHNFRMTKSRFGL